VLWFNKERFTEFLTAQTLVHVVNAMARGSNLDDADVAGYLEDARAILVAAAREGYRLDPFLNSLSASSVAP
jgi:hypothetical protein